MLLPLKKSFTEQPLTSAADFLSGKKIKITLPETVIMLPFLNFSKELSAISKKTYKLTGDIEIINDKVAVVHNFGLGAPAIVFMAEFLAALGAKRLLIAGSCGAISDKLSPGDRVICSGAYCGEGTSAYYTQKDFIETNTDLPLSSLGIKNIYPAWTTDALFRETPCLIEYFSAKGCGIVEMEASALFAFAESKNLQSGAVFVISDSLCGGEWKLPLTMQQVRQAIFDITCSLIKLV